MIDEHGAKKARALTLGSGILAVLAVFLTINAGWLFATAADEALFEQDTGAPRSEVTAEYPGLVSELTSIVRTSAVLMLGLALAVGAAALRGLRTSDGLSSSGTST